MAVVLKRCRATVNFAQMNDLSRSAATADEQRRAKHRLDDKNPRKRREALTGADWHCRGHRPASVLAGVVAAVAGGHAAIDRATRNDAANGAGSSAEKAVAEQAVTDDRAGNPADYLAGRRR